MEKIKSLPQDKQAMLEKWKTSGKSIKQYCLDENIPYHAMSYWQRKEKYLATGKDKKFIKVKLNSPSVINQNKTEIIYSNGTRIIFYGSTNVNELKQLAR
jgi:rRNA pseudouridine-1189 N-methylase Emg1 (Nep1/Mra1 family)